MPVSWSSIRQGSALPATSAPKRSAGAATPIPRADDAGIEFLDLKLLRVLGDISDGGENAGAVLQLDQAFVLQDAQRPAFVGRIVGQADDGAFGDLGDGLVLLRIEADRPDAGIADADDVVAVGLDLVVEIGLVLEGVGVDFAALERLVRLGVVVEGDGLDLETLLLRFGGHDTPDVFVLAAHDADLDGFFGSDRGKGGGKGCEREGRNGERCEACPARQRHG